MDDIKYLEVAARESEQCGYRIYGATCPQCGKMTWLNDLGRFLCQCGQWLRFVESRKEMSDG